MQCSAGWGQISMYLPETNKGESVQGWEFQQEHGNVFPGQERTRGCAMVQPSLFWQLGAAFSTPGSRCTATHRGDAAKEAKNAMLHDYSARKDGKQLIQASEKILRWKVRTKPLNLDNLCNSFDTETTLTPEEKMHYKTGTHQPVSSRQIVLLKIVHHIRKLGIKWKRDICLFNSTTLYSLKTILTTQFLWLYLAQLQCYFLAKPHQHRHPPNSSNNRNNTGFIP